jgi:hypothetical protein
MDYRLSEPEPSDPAAIEANRELLERGTSLAEGTPHWCYLTRTRHLPAEAVRRCSADLRALEPPIPYFSATDRGVGSLIRDGADDVIGYAVEACGPAGERVTRDGRTLRRFFSLSLTKKLSGGLFRAVAGTSGRAVLVEGHLVKPIAAAALFPGDSVYGFGSRSWLGLALPDEPDVLVIEDREPGA